MLKQFQKMGILNRRLPETCKTMEIENELKQL
jgi:hypothetical protein